MTVQTNGQRHVQSEDELEALMAQIEKGQQLAGHFPSDEALDRARRVATGMTSPEDALAEIDAKYAE